MGTSGPDGSSVSADSSSDSESNAEATGVTATWSADGMTRTITATDHTHNATAGGSQNVSVEDGRVTEADASSGGGGENQEVITRESKGPGCGYDGSG